VTWDAAHSLRCAGVVPLQFAWASSSASVVGAVASFSFLAADGSETTVTGLTTPLVIRTPIES
jgi:hypothetical protein